MAQTAGNVVVAGTGTVNVAAVGTALPTDVATALPVAWTELGYVSEDGVTFGLSRDQEDVTAWQAAEPVRSLVTAEPKSIEFELLEFGTPAAVKLALRGGVIAVAAGVATLTPPAAGVTDERAMVIEAVDGATKFRFCYSRVVLNDDVEWQLVKTDATRLPLSFGVLAGTWKIVTNHAAWVAAPGIIVDGTELTAAGDVVAAIKAGTLDEDQLRGLLGDERKTIAEAAASALDVQVQPAATASA